jgi:hypothetical protein
MERSPENCCIVEGEDNGQESLSLYSYRSVLMDVEDK